MADEIVECDPIVSQLQPTFITLNEEILRKAIEVCETAIENTQECLAIHQKGYGLFMTKKDMLIACHYESAITRAKSCRDSLRAAMRWPPIRE